MTMQPQTVPVEELTDAEIRQLADGFASRSSKCEPGSEQAVAHLQHATQLLRFAKKRAAACGAEAWKRPERVRAWMETLRASSTEQNP
jgi:hypothetical protein